MECSICFEKFFRPTSKEELKQLIDEKTKGKNENEIFRFYNLIITTNHNTTYKCSNNNCDCILCAECYTKYTCNGKDIYNMTFYDMPNICDTFTCPFCRNIDWKHYMNRVFNELQCKIPRKDAIN
jgi:hypothetical protein